jgi:hypothetical protein
MTEQTEVSRPVEGMVLPVVRLLIPVDTFGKFVQRDGVTYRFPKLAIDLPMPILPVGSGIELYGWFDSVSIASYTFDVDAGRVEANLTLEVLWCDKDEVDEFISKGWELV